MVCSLCNVGTIKVSKKASQIDANLNKTVGLWCLIFEEIRYLLIDIISLIIILHYELKLALQNNIINIIMISSYITFILPSKLINK